MKKLAAYLRSILLTITIIAGLVICVVHAKIEIIATTKSLPVLIFIGAGTLYLVVALISLIVRIICRSRMDERDQMMDSFTGVLVYLRNGNTLYFFRRLSFWGTIMLMVNIAAFDLTSNTFIGDSFSPDVFLSGYYGFLLWSLIALIVTFILSIVFWSVYMPHYGEGTYNVFQYVGKIIVSDITVPFRIIKSAFGNDKKKDIVDLTTMITFIVINAVAILKSV